MKQLRTFRLPLLECLDRGSVAQGPLWDRLIVDVDIMQHRLVELRCGSEVGSGDDLIDPAIEPLDPPVGWGVTRWDQAVVDTVGVTELIQGMMARGLSGAGGDETIGERFPVVGEDMGDAKGCLLNQVAQETLRRGSGLVLKNLRIDPTGGLRRSRRSDTRAGLGQPSEGGT